MDSCRKRNDVYPACAPHLYNFRNDLQAVSLFVPVTIISPFIMAISHAQPDDDVYTEPYLPMITPIPSPPLTIFLMRSDW